MSFFNEFHVADEKTCKARWSCGKPGLLFFCAFCGYKFVVGDEYRSTYTNDTDAGGNPLTCRPCDTKFGGLDGCRKVWIEMNQEYRTKFKYFYYRDLYGD